MDTLNREVPDHLKKYVVDQDYERYSYEDQAVWRYIMRNLKSFLSKNAHSCYVDGLEKTGIHINSIPRIDEMNQQLHEFGWGAVPVSGFIPPAAFMEFQSLGFLPIACDMRTVDHILYTPAPDIVHEAAGHAPILVDPKFANYLTAYAQVAAKAIISSEDMELYGAIRDLSDIKEHPDSTIINIKQAEQRLETAKNGMTGISEAALLGRMNWWTAEYGLIGDLNSPKIFGAGLLSSIGESLECLGEKVKKVPLNIECIEYTYDITEPQPQLFVTPNFESLLEVLEEFSETMSFKTGGRVGLDRAIKAKTINSVQLNSGLQISGELESYMIGSGDQIEFLKFSSPTQLCFDDKELEGHDKSYHSHGYSTPLGTPSVELDNISEGESLSFNYPSGISVNGKIKSILRKDQRVILVALENCSVKKGRETLFDPSWGTFDLAIGEHIPSVFGGPADRKAYGETDDFVAARVPKKEKSVTQIKIDDFYGDIRKLRNKEASREKLQKNTEELIRQFVDQFRDRWLIGVELLELCHKFSMDEKYIVQLKSILTGIKFRDSSTETSVQAGIDLAPMEI